MRTPASTSRRKTETRPTSSAYSTPTAQTAATPNRSASHVGNHPRRCISANSGATASSEFIERHTLVV